MQVAFKVLVVTPCSWNSKANYPEQEKEKRTSTEYAASYDMSKGVYSLQLSCSSFTLSLTGCILLTGNRKRSCTLHVVFCTGLVYHALALC